jgi:hypothetical protein
MQGCVAEMKTPTHWNLIGRSMTAPPPLLSPSSILLPLSPFCACSAARKNSLRVSKMLFILFILFYYFFFFTF